MDQVPCTCPACNGRLVSRYIRRQHVKLFGELLGANQALIRSTRDLTESQPTKNRDECVLESEQQTSHMLQQIDSPNSTQEACSENYEDFGEEVRRLMIKGVRLFKGRAFYFRLNLGFSFTNTASVHKELYLIKSHLYSMKKPNHIYNW